MNTARAETFYFKELERRKDLDAAPTFRVAALTLLGGVYSFYLKSFHIDGSIISWLFLIAATGTLVCGSLSVVWIVRSFVGFSWGYVPCADQLLAHHAELQKYHTEHGLDSGTPDTVFDEYLQKCFVEAASKNTRNNNLRSELLYSASYFLAVAVLFTLLAGVPVLYRALERAALTI